MMILKIAVNRVLRSRGLIPFVLRRGGIVSGRSAPEYSCFISVPARSRADSDNSSGVHTKPALIL